MSKYRILEIDNFFYPQKKVLGLFWNFLRYPSETAYLYCHTLEEAKTFIDEQIKMNNPSKSFGVNAIIHDYPDNQ